MLMLTLFRDSPRRTRWVEGTFVVMLLLRLLVEWVR